jgi:hypothetical protein
MAQQELHYVIRDIAEPSGGIRLELWVEQQRVATASVPSDRLSDMGTVLGMDRDAVRAQLERALLAQLRHQLAKVEVDSPRADPPGGLRFVSRYIYRDFDDITAGVVWYDVPSSTTGPDDLPAVIRNKMRFEVHRQLTTRSPNTHELVELLE